MNRLRTSDSERGGVMDANAAAPGRGVWRVFALLSVPFVLFTIGVVYLVEFSDLGLSLRDVAADEQATAVRYAIEHTTPAEVPHLLAAAGRASVDLTKTVLPYIEAQVTPADALTIYTRRRGLVRKLERQGYRLDGYVMRKTMQVIQ